MASEEYRQRYRYRARAAWRLHTLGFTLAEIGALMGIFPVTAGQYISEVKNGEM